MTAMQRREECAHCGYCQGPITDFLKQYLAGGRCGVCSAVCCGVTCCERHQQSSGCQKVAKAGRRMRRDRSFQWGTLFNLEQTRAGLRMGAESLGPGIAESLKEWIHGKAQFTVLTHVAGRVHWLD